MANTGSAVSIGRDDRVAVITLQRHEIDEGVAFALADAALVAPVDFVRLPLAAFLGYFLYHEPTSLFVFLGAAVIFTGNLLNIRGDRRRS